MVDRNDWWTYDPRDPSTYNVLQPRRVAVVALAHRAGPRTSPATASSTATWRCSTSTCRAACTARPTGSGWPTEPADTRLGGGIFLHVSGPGATAGCVSIPRGTMRRVLRWLDPAAGPVLVMGPRSAIGRL